MSAYTHNVAFVRDTQDRKMGLTDTLLCLITIIIRNNKSRHVVIEELSDDIIISGDGEENGRVPTIPEENESN